MQSLTRYFRCGIQRNSCHMHSPFNELEKSCLSSGEMVSEFSGVHGIWCVCQDLMDCAVSPSLSLSLCQAQDWCIPGLLRATCARKKVLHIAPFCSLPGASSRKNVDYISAGAFLFVSVFVVLKFQWCFIFLNENVNDLGSMCSFVFQV